MTSSWPLEVYTFTLPAARPVRAAALTRHRDVKVIIHAPTAAALARARANARSLLSSPAEGIVRIVVSDDAVSVLLDEPDPHTDRLVVLCAESLARAKRKPPPWMETTPHSGYLVSRLQKKGWSYLRA